MKISQFIFLGFLLILSMFSITTYINYRLAEQVNENSAWLGRSTTIIRHTNRFQRNILNMISGLRGYLFTGEQYFVQAYDSAAAENEVIINELDTLIAGDSRQAEAVKQIKLLNTRWLDEFANPLMVAKRSSEQSDSSMLAFNRLYREKLRTGTEMTINNRLQTALKNFSNYEYNLRDTRKAALDISIERTGQISFYLTTFSIVAGFCIAAFLAYRISSRIIKMVSMADTIAAGNYQVSMNDTGKDEISRLAQSLNHMAKVLAENISLLQRKNQELDQFAHIVSHDMKAPLRGIDNVITWIEEDHLHELSPKVQEYIQLIKGRLVRGESLISGILSYSRVGRDEVDKEEVNITHLLYDIYDSVPHRAGIKLIVQPNMPVLVTERVPLMQVFSNLISNAIKYHDKQEGTVRVYFKDHDSHYEFFVEDNGPGILKNYHNKIFVIFQTLHERDNFESTGVGLAIVKKILEDRKQEIKIMSEPGKGATFSFTWPKS